MSYKGNLYTPLFQNTLNRVGLENASNKSFRSTECYEYVIEKRVGTVIEKITKNMMEKLSG